MSEDEVSSEVPDSGSEGATYASDLEEEEDENKFTVKFETNGDSELDDDEINDVDMGEEKKETDQVFNFDEEDSLLDDPFAKDSQKKKKSSQESSKSSQKDSQKSSQKDNKKSSQKDNKKSSQPIKKAKGSIIEDDSEEFEENQEEEEPPQSIIEEEEVELEPEQEEEEEGGEVEMEIIEEEKPEKKGNNKGKKQNSKKKKQVELSESEDKEEQEQEEEEEEEKPKKKKPTKKELADKKKQNSKKKPVESPESDKEEDEEEKPKTRKRNIPVAKKTKAAPKKASKPKATKPKATAKKAAPKKAPKASPKKGIKVSDAKKDVKEKKGTEKRVAAVKKTPASPKKSPKKEDKNKQEKKSNGELTKKVKIDYRIAISGYNEEDNSELAKILKSYPNIQLIEENDLLHSAKKPTHIVLGSKKRTIKVLYGISFGILFVSQDWIFDSQNKKKENKNSLLPEKLYKQNFWPGIAKSIKSEENLLENTKATIFIEVPTKVPKDHLEKLIQHCGGKLAETSFACDILITQNPTKRRTEPLGEVEKNIIKEEWLLDSISNWKIQPFEKYEFTANEKKALMEQNGKKRPIEEIKKPQKKSNKKQKVNEETEDMEE